MASRLWVEVAGMRKTARHVRTMTEDPLATEIHLTHRRYIGRLAARIHEKALELPIYRLVFERLGLKGPILAYLISHDELALRTLPRNTLTRHYGLYHRPWRRRTIRGHLIIMLANTATLNKHPKYIKTYDDYQRRGKTHWKAVTRVALKILRDIRQIARQTSDT